MNITKLRLQIRDTLFYYLLIILIFFLRILSRPNAIRIMRIFGRLLYLIGGTSKKRTLRHLTEAYGTEKTPEEIRTISRGVFLHLSTVLADVIRMENIIQDGIANLVTTENIEYLEQALAGGRGAIMITAHFGNWELLGAWLAQNGYPLKVIGTSMDDPRLDNILVKIRNQAGYTNIARGKDTREIIRWLRKGHPIGMLIDQDTKVQGTFVQFFNRPTFTPTGAALLARKFKLPIIPMFMRINEDYTYHLECGEPFHPTQTDDEEKDLLKMTQQCSDIYEEIIRRHPSQWVWMHKRWKTRPKSKSKTV